ncbi:MAG: septation protein IspZ [Sphingomonadales bacterium]|nr:septation protein IspZ [Sphingomonadales bacterium]
MTETVRKKGAGWLNFAVDYGPVLVFFLVYRHYAPANHGVGPERPVAEVMAVIRSTVAFMAAAVVALAVSWWKLRRISAMLGLSTALIVVFGGLTVFLRDSFWIQVKPTVIYLLFGLSLLAGVWKGKALLKVLLASAFEGLDDDGWMILSRNWGWFFLFFAALNEVLRHYFNAANNGFGTWIALKLWLFMPVSLLFTFAHIPMLLRHGLGEEAPTDIGGEAG